MSITMKLAAGNRRNSPDALLMFHKIRPDWTTGQVALLQTTFFA